MALNFLDNIRAQLAGLIGPASTSFAAPDSVYNPMSGMGGTNLPPEVDRLKEPGSLGFNLGTGQLALGGLSALGSLLAGKQALGLAKDQFDFTKSVTNTNLNNQIQSYNTALSDRARARGVAEGQSDAEVQAYIDRNRLAR